MDVGLPRPVARRLRERLPRLRPAEGALRARRRLRRRGRLQGPEVGGRPLVQERPQRRGQDGQGDTVARRHPGMGAVPRDRGAQGPRRRPRRRDREARDGEAAAPGVPSPPRLRLRRHDAGRQPPEVLDVRLPQVARRHTPRRRRRHPGADGAEERGRGGGRGARRPPRRVQGRRRGGPPLGRGRGAPVDQGVRVRARRRLRVRGRRLLEVPLRQAGDGLLRPRPEAEVERGLRAPRRDQRGRQRARQEAGVSVNLFFTSFAKQARRSRKGGFTGCANVFSPIPVTA